MKKLYFILLIVLASSCTPNLQKAIEVATETEANAEATINAIHKEQRIVGANFAARYYPPKVGKVIPGKEQVSEETTEEKPVVVPCEDEQGQPVEQVECPPAKVTVRTIYRTDTLKVLDAAVMDSARIMTAKHEKAREKAEENELEKVQENKALEDDLTKAYIFGGIMLLIIAAMFYWFVIRRR